MPEIKKSSQEKFLNLDPRVWKGAFFLLGLSVLLSLYSHNLGFFGLLILCGHLAFFREPSFKSPVGATLVSPCYGQVADIEIVKEDKFLHEEAYRIGVFMSVFVPHITLSPIQGKIGYLEHVPGKFMGAMLRDAITKNECNWIGIEDVRGRVMVRQITGAIARRIFWDVEVGSEVAMGEKIGMICYGSRIECFLPVRLYKPAVKVGEHLKAGISIIGEKV